MKLNAIGIDGVECGYFFTDTFATLICQEIEKVSPNCDSSEDRYPAYTPPETLAHHRENRCCDGHRQHGQSQPTTVRRSESVNAC